MREDNAYPADAHLQQLHHMLKRERLIEEHEAFVDNMTRRKPIMTWAIAVVLVLVFIAELYFGDSESAQLLLSMGALSPEKVQAGEWWRLGSATLLHAGFAHIACNTYVLVAIGNGLERVIGSWRFMAVYGLSALAASGVSFLMLGESFSVGASGAIWGLLCAQGLLAYYPRGILPEHIAERHKKAAKANLVINIVISFLPMIDMYAHFAGGAAGALLVYTGFATQGLGKPKLYGSVKQPPTFLQGLAAVGSALFLLTSMGFAIERGQVWTLNAPQLAYTPVGTLPFEVQLPERLISNPNPSDGVTASFGQLPEDPAVVAFDYHAHGMHLNDDEIQLLVNQLFENLENTDSGDWIPTDEACQKALKHTKGYLLSKPYKGQHGTAYHKSLLVLPDGMINIETLIFTDFEKYRDLNDTVLESFRPTSTP